MHAEVDATSRNQIGYLQLAGWMLYFWPTVDMALEGDSR